MAALSPERQALAQACQALRGGQEWLDRLRAAEEAAKATMYDAAAEVEAAEEAFKQAKASERQRVIAAILATPAPPGPDAEEALAALAAHKAVYGKAELQRDAIREEITKAEQRLTRLEYERQEAIGAVLASDPGLERLMLIYDRARGCAAECASVLYLIGKTRLPDHLQNWEAVNRKTLTPAVAILEPWKAALASLEAGNVDTMLPTLSALESL